MRKRVAFWSLWLISRSAFADPSPEVERFLATPEAVWSYSPDKEVVLRVSEMDSQLIEAVQPFFSVSPKVDGDSYTGFKLDLNGDGEVEYFIRTPLGGSGGAHRAVFMKKWEKWVLIADFQGGFHLLPAKKGWKPIVGYTRGGADSYYKFRLDYTKGRYRETWAATIEGGVVKEKAIPNAASDQR